MSNNNDFLHIAIDGPAGAGKSSVARAVARRLGILYLDTGAMYRALTWKSLQQGVDPADAESLTRLAGDTSIVFDAENHRVLCDNIDVTDVIRAPRVSSHVSTVATVPGVRARLTELQRRAALECSLVLDGRDIGTYVLPQAPVKVFLTADLRQRALRRQRDLLEQSLDMELDQVTREIAARDERDSQRAAAPLTRADDAILIDTSRMAFDDVVEEVLELVRRRVTL